MGFCAFCNHEVDAGTEQCPECGNRRFCFLTGQVRFDPRLSRVDEIGLKDALIEYIEETGLEDAEELPESYFEERGPITGLMEYVDTRAGRTWWEPYHEIEFRIKQLRDFAGQAVLDRIAGDCQWPCDNTALLNARRSTVRRRLLSDSLYFLGVSYGSEGGSTSAPLILSWFDQAKQGHAKAQFKTWWTLYRGFGPIKADLQGAIAWLEAAANKGYAPAQCSLGLLYQLGEGVPEDYVQAYAWLTLAGEYGLKTARSELSSLERDLTLPQVAEALYRLGVWAECNENLPPETGQKRAMRWFQKAAHCNHIDAQFQLSVGYALGIGVTRDEDKALAWCIECADRGYAPAQYELGSRYADGEGVAKDAKQAMVWLRKAAEQGHANAQMKLAELYASSDYMPPDPVLAYFWAHMATLAGIDTATKLKDQLSQSMTESQLCASRRLCDNLGAQTTTDRSHRSAVPRGPLYIRSRIRIR
jgi:TPR repeat protein